MLSALRYAALTASGGAFETVFGKKNKKMPEVKCLSTFSTMQTVAETVAER